MNFQIEEEWLEEDLNVSPEKQNGQASIDELVDFDLGNICKPDQVTVFFTQDDVAEL